MRISVCILALLFVSLNVLVVDVTDAVSVAKFSRKAHEGLTLQASMDALSDTIDDDSFADNDDENLNVDDDDNILNGDESKNRTKTKQKLLQKQLLREISKNILLQRLKKQLKSSKTGSTGPTGIGIPVATGMTGTVGTGATGLLSTGPTGNFGDGETGATGSSESGGTGVTGATGLKEEEEKETLFHSKVLTAEMVSIVKRLALNLTTDGSNLNRASKTFGNTAKFANLLVEKLLGKSNETMETLSTKYPLITAQCEKVKGKKILEKVRNGLLNDASFVHEALVERLPKPVEIRDMVVETGYALKSSAEFIGSKPRCLGECAIEKSRIQAKENVKRKKILNKVHIKCVEEEVRVENEFMIQMKKQELANEKSNKGLLEFSKLVVEMNDKVALKEKRIADLKAKLKHLNDEVNKMDSNGGKNAKLMLSNIRTKCLTEAATESSVEVKHNKEELREVYNAKKVIFAMHQRHLSLTRQFNMEFERAPAFSDVEKCKQTLDHVKHKMYLPNPHSDHCLSCKGVMDIRKNEGKAYCVWPRRNKECEEIAFLSGKCKAPSGLPKVCYDAILYGPKAIRSYLKTQGFPLYTPPRIMSNVVTQEELADSHLGAATNSLNLTVKSSSDLLRDEIEKMNNKLKDDDEDDEEELHKKHKVRKIIRTDDDDDETGATGISGASGISGISGASGLTGATGMTGAGATALGLTDDDEISNTGSTGMTGGPTSRVEKTATAASGNTGGTGATSSTGSQFGSIAMTSMTGSNSKTGMSGATGSTTGATGNDIEIISSGPSEKEMKLQEARKEMLEKRISQNSLNEDENSNVTI
jgi:hypothetical protein